MIIASLRCMQVSVLLIASLCCMQVSVLIDAHCILVLHAGEYVANCILVLHSGECVAHCSLCCMQVSVLIDETYYDGVTKPGNISQLLQTFGFSAADALKLPKSIFRLDGRVGASGSYDWLETSVVRPDLVSAALR
jgi:hypothetical protein